MTHGAQAMGDHHRSAITGDLLQGPLDRRFGVVVDRGGCFIEHQHWRILKNGAGQGDALTLATGEALTPLPHHRVVTIRQGIDECSNLRQLRRPMNGITIWMANAVGNVLGNGAVE